MKLGLIIIIFLLLSCNNARQANVDSGLNSAVTEKKELAEKNNEGDSKKGFQKESLYKSKIPYSFSLTDQKVFFAKEKGLYAFEGRTLDPVCQLTLNSDCEIGLFFMNNNYSAVALCTYIEPDSVLIFDRNCTLKSVLHHIDFLGFVNDKYFLLAGYNEEYNLTLHDISTGDIVENFSDSLSLLKVDGSIIYLYNPNSKNKDFQVMEYDLSSKRIKKSVFSMGYQWQQFLGFYKGEYYFLKNDKVIKKNTQTEVSIPDYNMFYDKQIEIQNDTLFVAGWLQKSKNSFELVRYKISVNEW